MITEGVICTRCAHELELDDIWEGEEDYGNTYVFHCPYCGARYECTEVPESEKDEYEFYKDGKEDISMRINEPDIMNGHCTNCGHHVSMSNNFMLSDYDDSITNEDDDKMNFILNQCPYCGMQEVRWDNSENEKNIYPYWKEDLESNQE